jgi:glucans biosynthesis protein
MPAGVEPETSMSDSVSPYRRSPMHRSLLRPPLGRRRFLAAAGGLGVAGLLPAHAVFAADPAPQPGNAPAPAPAPTEPPPAFTFEDVKRRARELAGQDFRDERGRLPDALRNLSYDQYRDIRFRPDQAVWRGAKLFQIQLFHLGFLYDRPVRLNIVSNGQIQPLTSRADMFDYGKNDLAGKLPDDLGFAGFRLHFPLQRPDYFDEIATFLGASYFRVLGRNQQYGLSARGLAVDTAGPKGEDFPWFREFWIEEPGADAKQLTFYALLDSASAVGAYKFVLDPGTATTTDITASIQPRRDIEKLGVAPLTSMFFYGEDSTRRFDDFRPEVHDSDGLRLHTGHGEWIWRPLANPRDLRISSFSDENPKGFGLMQRDRAFSAYQDLEAHYERRPGYWIEPLGEWGKGRVELVEIPTDQEINDNIVAYWVPERPVRAGEGSDLSYRLHAVLDRPENNPGRSPGGKVVATRLGSARTPGRPDMPEEARHFVLDFAGGDLGVLRPEQPVEAVVTASSGEVRPAIVHKNGETGGWRAFFDFLPAGSKPADLRCYLRLRGESLTESWVYLWSPP